MVVIKNIDSIAACSDLGVHVDGSKLGPEILINSIDSSLIHNLKYVYNKDRNYKKELDKNNLKKNLAELNSFNENLYAVVLDSLQKNYFPITIGGDHSIAIGSSLASIKKYNNLGIIWFDAHGDFNTFETTTSGNIHGIPFASVTHFEPSLLTTFHSGNYFNPKNAVLLGGRDIDMPGELQNLKDAGVTIISSEDIKKYGIDNMAAKAFNIASNGTEGIHISYDIDVIDPSIAPGVSIPAINGIDLNAASSFVDYIIKNREKIKSLDLVEFNPLKDINKKTEKIALNILNKLLSEF